MATQVTFAAAEASDLDALVALRIEAMRESLERVGRFDPVRARERFAAGFAPEHTRHVLADGKRVGFVVVKPQEGGLLLDHLYIQPAAQGAGIGAAVLARVFAEADAKALPLRVGALRESAANRFYARHGFALVEQAEFDNYYVRPPATAVTLREITADTVGAVIRLSVAESQKGFVATNAVSLAQALFAPEAWYRAIYVGEAVAGFVMLEDESLRTPAPAQPKIGVWRLMVDERFQGRGIGRAALLQVIEHARTKGLFSTLELSYVPGPGCPEPFYRGLGFRPTGRMDGVEVVLEFPLKEQAS
jgi:diamine N-acetyltransferase